MLDFAKEVAKYTKSNYFGSVQAYCFTLLAMQLVEVLFVVLVASDISCDILLSTTH